MKRPAELHSLVAASGAIVENRPMSPQTVPAGFDLNVSMLRDPENREMTWSFADGSTESGIWVITADGKLTLKAGVADYEALTTRHEERTVFLGGSFPGGNLGPIIIDVPVRDHSLATQTLSVKAIDALGRSVSGTFTATIDHLASCVADIVTLSTIPPDITSLPYNGLPLLRTVPQVLCS